MIETRSTGNNLSTHGKVCVHPTLPTPLLLGMLLLKLWLKDLRKMEKAYITTHSTATYKNNNNFICISHNSIRFFRHLDLKTFSGKIKIIGETKCLETLSEMKSQVIFHLESTNFKNISTIQKCLSFTHFFF